MAYCFECGEQVAENDVFCPYCGISLQPIAVAGAEDDDSFTKTVAVSFPVADAAPPPPASEAAAARVENSAAENSDGALDAAFFDDFKPGAADVPIAAAPQSDAIAETSPAAANRTPSAAIDDNEQNFFDRESRRAVISPTDFEAREQAADAAAPPNLPAFDGSATPDAPRAERFPTSFDKDDAPAPDSSADAAAAPPADLGVQFDFKLKDDSNDDRPRREDEPVADRSEESAPAQTESSLMAYEEAPVKEYASGAEAARAVNENAEEVAAESPFGAFDGDVQPIAPNQTTGDSDPFAAAKPETDGENAAFAPVGDFSAAPAVEQPIAMPEIELPAAEVCPPSRFDSVSIMEKKEPVEAASEKPAPPENAASAAASVENVAASGPVGSFTAPISAGSDTGSKNKTKLKPLDEGTVLNSRYEIIRKIGGGGMGAVYLASDKNLGGVLRAVKEMVQSYIEDAQQEKAVSDFKRESLLLTSLDHPAIPTIYDYFFDESEARFYLVMKYISGGDLSSRLRSAPESRIDERDVIEWAIQIADVLDYLHNRQPPIVYRDLKPANIMVDGNSGRAMLIDFGIARWVNKEEKGVTAVGTMGYAPPELFSGNVEARSDIYSLGSTMFHLLTGADPQSNPLLIFDFQKHPRPRQINPQLSDQMEQILMRSVEYNAEKRFASAAEMKRALEEHRDNLKAGRATFGVKAAPVAVALSDQPVFCGFCGQKIVATDMFCAFCGSKQPMAQQGVHSESYSSVPLTAQLLIVGTNDLEQPAFRLEKEDNLVGRRDPMSNIFPEVDLSKFDPQTKISRRHARIWREGNEFMLEDLGSSNGTYLLPVVSDTRRLPPRQPQPLTNGDKIRLGDTTLHFILG